MNAELFLYNRLCSDYATYTFFCIFVIILCYLCMFFAFWPMHYSHVPEVCTTNTEDLLLVMVDGRW